MAKSRIPVPNEIAASLMLRSDRTCCVCCEPGKPTQIHHVNEDPGNNHPNNLALLCLHCHENTQIHGGFGRKLDSHSVVAFRDAWHIRVQNRRDEADRIAAQYQSSANKDTASEYNHSSPTPESLINYLRVLPAIRQAIYIQARQKWNTGVTSNQRQGFANVSDVIEQILNSLATWYPSNYFDGREPRDYINSLAASRYLWHRAQLQPYGHGKHGTMIGPLVARHVMNDLEIMVLEMVSSLSRHFVEFDFGAWKIEWEDAAAVSEVQC